jgi:virginiamycin B lyase
MPSVTALRHPGLDAPSGIITAFDEVWFTNIGADNVGRVREGRIEVFDGPPGSGIRFPANIFPGSDGRVWFTSLGSDALAAIDPAAPDPAQTITTYPLPENSRPVALKAGSDGRLWFSLRGTDAIGTLDPADPSGSLRLVTGPAIAGPAALFVAADDSVWWVNSTSGTVGGYRPATETLTTVDALPASPRAWAQTPDGLLWLTTRQPAGLLCFNPGDPSGTLRHITDPQLAEPDGICAAADGTLWLVDTAANAIVGYTPGSAASWHRYGAPPDVDGPFDIKPGPHPTVMWFTNKAGNSIGQLSALPTEAC